MTALPSPADVPALRTFADMGVSEPICAALADAGITTPFPIQELTLPLGLSGADLIGQARTGTGKTLAFGIPLLQRLAPDRNATQGLVVVPTRELCIQVRDDLERAGARTGTRIVAVYGGKAIDPQAEALARGAPIVVGTPGRLLDLRRRGVLDLSAVTTLVLDEADEMLDLGFLPDVEQIIRATDPDRQTLLFSATMPSAVVGLARRYMRKPTFLRADVEESRVAPETRQYFLACHPMDKPAVLARILQSPGRGLCVVFTRTKRMADTVAADLRDRDIAAAPIHSDLRQEARERALARFRAGKVDVLVATEVAARGLDITDVTHVINYDCPDDEKMYLHRIGRTGRAGAAGAAITLAVWHEQTRLEVIKKALAIDEPTHEVFSTSPILDELFDLPTRPPRPRIPSERSPRRGARRRAREEPEAPAQEPSAVGSGDLDGGDADPARSRRVRRRRRGPRMADTDEPQRPVTGRDTDVTEGRDARGPSATFGEKGRHEPQEADRAGDAGPGEAQPASATRNRTRTRRRGERRGAEPDAGGPAGRPVDGTAVSPGVEGEPARPGGRSGDDRRGPDDRRATDEGSDRDTTDRRGDRQSTGRRGPGARGTRRSRRGTGRSQRQPATVPGQGAHPGSSAVLRGGGRPRLTRPLAIAHLP